ncbi:hypothetical protein M409DRAFT_23582 [Zasmidium cellare ATCC 36951]|uniref:PPPDE domain-containing protein n=1 Tax=Zasmidium cellare ATCC 36951 TaxID=1080233 RepID=A0A6A6CIG3_ZASCE|nr:uncharacterized protein M409DRAFT_23582 [Zasmidium cellare ATCC 36951]KAF2166393.1 hypothetical protein M409DRAFT_23582 [Zasmidium cellare ATCC 36951]
MANTKHVYVVYEPIHAESSLPMTIQQLVGFSHAKLVVLSSGQIDGQGRSKGKGNVYDIWKDGKQEIGYGDERGRPIKWDGLATGERFRHLCYTDKSDKEVMNAAASVIAEMKTYNLVFRNCEDFAYRLGEKLTRAMVYPGWLPNSPVNVGEYEYLQSSAVNPFGFRNLFGRRDHRP